MKIYAAYVDDHDYEIWDLSFADEYLEEEEDLNVITFKEYTKRNYRDYVIYAKDHSPVSDTDWVPDMTRVNAYYYPAKNAMVIPAAIINGQFYRPDMDKEERLSNIGVVIAHEISHAFDGTGSKVDENGERKEWWTEEDRQNFNERADRIVDYFDHLIVMPEDTNYSGLQVEDEAIADLSAMQCMLHIAKSIEGFDYDRFFKGYANLYRSKKYRGYTLELIETSHHPCDFLRVNMIVRQFREFHDTYHTKPGDRMYQAPEDSLCIF